MESSLFDIFLNLEDPRDNRGKKHLLIHVIILSIYGILCGYTDFVNMAYFLSKHEKELADRLGLLNGIPSHDTFSNVFRIIDPDNFMKLFISWIKKMADIKDCHIAIDGKAIKSARDKINNGKMPYVVSAFLVDSGLSIGQVKVEDKTNEIKAIPDLLDLLDIKDATITIDAIGTQKDIIDKIIQKGGHYCLNVKDNQRELHEDIKNHFEYILSDSALKETLSSYETIDKDHGRIEKRKYYLINDLEGFVYNKNKWSSIKSIGMIISTREENNKVAKEIKYHILDKEVSISEYVSYTRSHWAIENKLHWILDVIFNEDCSTARKDNAIINLATIKKIAFNLTKLDPDLQNKTTKKKMIDFISDFNVFERLVYNVNNSLK